MNRCRILINALCFALVLFTFASAQQGMYKNLSVNKTDVIDSLWQLLAAKTYPHAQSNSECRGDPTFRARCALSDTIKNTCHGAGCPSWGPEQVPLPWWKVSFGKQVLVDSVAIYLRADFPHDGYFCKGRIVFSDNSSIRITLDSSARRQGFKFTPRVISSLTIDSLLWHVPLTWCAITQVQVYGYDQWVGTIPQASTGLKPNPSCPLKLFFPAGPATYRLHSDAATVTLYGLNGRCLSTIAASGRPGNRIARIPDAIGRNSIVVHEGP